MTQDQVSQELAIGKHIISYAAGAATVIGIMTQVDADTLTTSFDHIVNGVKEISVGVSPLIALAMGLWARYNSSLSAKKAAVVTSAPGTMVVQTGGDTTAVAAKLAAMPEVHSVTSTPAVAAATVSDKVVSS